MSQEETKGVYKTIKNGNFLNEETKSRAVTGQETRNVSKEYEQAA